MRDFVPLRETSTVDEDGGGGPAGVVDIWLNGLCDLPGVDGGLDSGNLKDMLRVVDETVV